VTSRGATFYLDEGSVHEFLDDDHCGIATNTAAICTKFISFMLGRLGCDEDGHTQTEDAQRRALCGIPPLDAVGVLWHS
jgi:hypothetical protein